MDVHPSGPRPRVLPVEPYRAMATPTSGYAPDSSHQPGRPPIIPRRTKHLQSVEESPPERPGQTSRFPGSPGDFKSYRPRTLSHGESQGPSIYGHGNSTHSTVETNSTQRQEELHLLRIRVEDLGVENNKKERELQFSNDQIKQLNTLLTEKKEELLKSEDRVVALQADLSESKERVLDLERDYKTIQLSSRSTSESEASWGRDSEAAWGREVVHLRGLLDERLKELDYCKSQLEKERGQWKMQVMDFEEEIRQRQNQELALKRELQQAEWGQRRAHQAAPPPSRQNIVDTDTKSKIEMLEAQVAIYREDFETEREDRARAQGSISKLKEELASLQKTNELLINERGMQQPLQR